MRLDFSSLRTRFMIATIAAVIIGTILTGLVVARVIHSYVVDRFHEEMEEHIKELAELSAVDAKGQPYLLRHLSDARFVPPGSGFYWEVERAGYKKIRSPSLDGNNLPVGLANGPEPLWQFIIGPSGGMLEYAMTKPMTDGGPPLLLYVATDQRLIDELLAEIDWPLIYSLGAFAIIMVLIGAIQINYIMRPLHKIQASISAIRNGTERRMLGDYPSEIKPLVSSLNQLLTSNWEMLQSARVQAGNLAHGLRTPLAIIADEAQLMADKDGSESAAVLLQSCEQMQRYIAYYTSRTRMAAQASPLGHHSALDKALEPIIIAMRRLYRDRGLELIVTHGPNIEVSMDEVDLTEILSNLIDNACKWATTSIQISWYHDKDAAVLLIDDDGPGITEIQRETVFKVGERLDRSEFGTGLGLAIVKDLLLHYRGSVGLETSPLGGLRVELRVPYRP
ncbi:MAG: hypothetical protein CFE36_01780 [Sphingomonadaceae bacterium PASS1]|jgi:signal transduction histidine kinase|nr:MAG: hypothetical protein CFE36_01780 [Sphingomonadaceae bacterium PASS1]